MPSRKPKAANDQCGADSQATGSGTRAPFYGRLTSRTRGLALGTSSLRMSRQRNRCAHRRSRPKKQPSLEANEPHCCNGCDRRHGRYRELRGHDRSQTFRKLVRPSATQRFRSAATVRKNQSASKPRSQPHRQRLPLAEIGELHHRCFHGRVFACADPAPAHGPHVVARCFDPVR